MYKAFKKTNQRNMIIGGVALIAILLVVIGFLFFKYNNLKKDPQAAAKETTKSVIAQVSKLYVIPTNEEPTVAQVQDKAKLKDQPFFSNAQNGDYILVYAKNKLALIYREDIHKLINVGPINTEGVAGESAAKTAVAVLNGSGDGGKLNAAITKLTDLGSQIAVQDPKPDAKNKNTAKTIVVDVTGQNTALAKTIADKLGATVETKVPAGETAPAGAAIVIIVGKS